MSVGILSRIYIMRSMVVDIMIYQTYEDSTLALTSIFYGLRLLWCTYQTQFSGGYSSNSVIALTHAVPWINGI